MLRGKLYDYKLMNKIVDADGKTVKQYDSKSTDISGTLTQSQWDAIHQGMRMVVEDLHDVFGGFTGVEVSVRQEQHSRLRQDQTMHCL